jgi:hypothetical protein
MVRCESHTPEQTPSSGRGHRRPAAERLRLRPHDLVGAGVHVRGGNPAGAVERGSSDWARAAIQSPCARPGSGALQRPPGPARWCPRGAVCSQPSGDRACRHRHAPTANVLGRTHLGCVMLRRPRHDRANRRGACPAWNRRVAGGPVPRLGRTAIRASAGGIHRAARSTGGGLCRYAEVAWFSPRCAALTTCRDRPRGWTARASSPELHVPARQLR